MGNTVRDNQRVSAHPKALHPRISLPRYGAPVVCVPFLPGSWMGHRGQRSKDPARSMMKQWVCRWLKKEGKAGLKSESHLGGPSQSCSLFPNSGLGEHRRVP